MYYNILLLCNIVMVISIHCSFIFIPYEILMILILIYIQHDNAP